MPGKQVYEFGPYRVDVALSRVERAGAAIPLPPKAFDLLVLLARNPDRVVGKSELIDTLWPNTFVDDANLTQHVYTLRKALGDQPDGRPYIETVARRGYRLAAVLASTCTPNAASSLLAAADAERKHATVLHCTISSAERVTGFMAGTVGSALIPFVGSRADRGSPARMTSPSSAWRTSTRTE